MAPRAPLSPGSVPGWGMSWWFAENGLLERVPQMTMSERLEHICEYWRAVGEGWEPPVPREDWHPYHPWEPYDEG